MKHLKIGLTTLMLLASLVFSTAGNALVIYQQNFDAMTPAQGWPPNDLSDDGWLVYGIAYDANPYTGAAKKQYDYGPSAFPAANGPPGPMQVVAPEPGNPANNVLIKYSDYNNPDQIRYYISASTFQEQSVTAADVGNWRFTFDARRDLMHVDSSAYAYIQTLDSAGVGTAIVDQDTTSLPDNWDTYTLDFLVTDAMIGNTLQFGFVSIATNYNDSSVRYDNLMFAPNPIPAPSILLLLATGLIALTLAGAKHKR